MGLRGRPEFGPGSREPRLNPEFRSARTIKRGPLVRETSTNGPVSEDDRKYRRRLIGLPPRFDNS